MIRIRRACLPLLALFCLLTASLALAEETPGVETPGAETPAEETSEETSTDPAPAKKVIEDEIFVVLPGRFALMGRESVEGQFLTREEVGHLPHLADDPQRAINRLPGTAGGDISSRLYLRGGDSDELLFLFDGQEIVKPYHLEDLQNVFTIVDSEVIGGLALYTGGYPAQYGNRMSGVLDLQPALPAEKRRVELGISFTNARFQIAGRTKNDSSWLLSARRGYLDLVLDFVDPGGDLEPKYYDVVGRLERPLGDRQHLSATILSAGDDNKFIDDDDDDQVSSDHQNHFFWLNWKSSWSSRFNTQAVLSATRYEKDRRGRLEEGTTVRDERTTDQLGLKFDGQYQATSALDFEFGLETKQLEATYDYASHVVPASPILVDGQLPTVRDAFYFFEPDGDQTSAYVQSDWRPSASWLLSSGVRYDRQSYTDEDQVSPRLAAAVSPRPGVTFSLAWGLFYQPQAIYELQVEDGVLDFSRAQRAEHRLLGMSWQLPHRMSLRVEAYQKKIERVRPRFENLFDPIELLPEVESDRVLIAPESAEATGAELMLRGENGRWSWWTAYAYSETRDEFATGSVRRSWDQPHAFSFGIDWRLSALWNLYLAGTWHTGWPTTAIVQIEVLPLPDGQFALDVTRGPRNGERFEDFYRLDLRASRDVPISRGQLSFYLEVFNLLDRDNPCCVDSFTLVSRPGGGNVFDAAPNYDHWLPIIPSFGVSWKF